MAKFTPLVVPTNWTETYTPEDQERIATVITWLNSHRKQQPWLAAIARIKKPTLHQILSGKYPSPVAHFVDVIMTAIETAASRNEIKAIPFVETELARLVATVCKRARKYRDFGILTGSVGIGKTRAFTEYALHHANTFLIEADPGMTACALMDDLLAAAGITAGYGERSREKKARLFIQKIRDTDTLIIVDEAETLNHASLHLLRRLRDKAHIGVVLGGTEKLHGLITPVGGEFDQIRSRVGMWPLPVKKIRREDADAVIDLAFDDQDEFDSSINDRLWRYCNGSMRMLAENLIPTIRDYGLKNNSLSTDLIDRIAVEVLSLPKIA